MKRPGVALVVSVITNAVLSLWLVLNYFYDVYFQGYVNTTIGQANPLLLAGIIAIGSSGIGYLYIRKRPRSYASGRLQKSRIPRQGPSLPPAAVASFKGRSPQPSAHSLQETKHTAYAVPTLFKSSKPEVPGPEAPRTVYPTFGAPSKLPPQLPQKTESHFPTSTGVPARMPAQDFRRIQGERTGSSGQTGPRAEQPLNKNFAMPSGPATTTSKPPQWVPGKPSLLPPMREQKSETTGVFTGPGAETSFGVRPPPPPSQAAGQTPPPPSTFQPKWKIPEPTGKQSQWVDPVPKQGFSTPQRWGPQVGPSQSPRPNVSTPPLGPGQVARRPPPIQQRPPPRPLAYPGVLGAREYSPTDRGVSRPSEGTPQAGAAPFRSSPSPQRIPPLQPHVVKEKGSVPDVSPPEKSAVLGRPEAQPVLPADSNAASSTGEMDWDTALDTILKTLRKDKIAENG